MSIDVSVARFAPMRRLLSGEDEDYLIRQGFRREAGILRAQHRKIYFRFVDMLQADFRTTHAALKGAMSENWDFEALLKAQVTASYYLWLMRTAGMMHLLRVPQAAKVAQTYFDHVQDFIKKNPTFARAQLA